MRVMAPDNTGSLQSALLFFSLFYTFLRGGGVGDGGHYHSHAGNKSGETSWCTNTPAALEKNGAAGSSETTQDKKMLNAPNAAFSGCFKASTSQTDFF